MSPVNFKKCPCRMSLVFLPCRHVTKAPCRMSILRNGHVAGPTLVVQTHTSEGLQEQIDGLYKFCCKWHMIVSLSKTKVLIFNQKINDGRVFKVGDNHIEVVN